MQLRYSLPRLPGFFVILLLSQTVFAERMPPVHPVSQVDLKKYLGKWYEIARLPNWFQRKCAKNTTAEYSLRKDGVVLVTNTCQNKNDEIQKIEGKAKVVDASGNAKLKVTFFWPFYGDYWILELGPNYEYAVVGDPSRKYLWILSRTPTMETSVFVSLLEKITAQGYDSSKIVLTPQK